jgi:hypothetical protein
MTDLSQILMFWSSYAPLFAVFAILDSFGKGVPSLICAIAAGLGLVMPVLLQIDDSGGFRTPLPIESVHPFRSFRTPRGRRSRAAGMT